MMLLKCFTQYASKFAKLSNGHRTIKAEFSFQSQRRAMTKNVQTTIQLHMLARKCSKFFMLILGIIRSFSCTRDGITAFRSLVNHRAVHTHIVHQSNSALSTSTSLTILNPLTVWLTTNSGKLLYRREYQTNLPAS